MLMRICEKDNIDGNRTLFQQQWAEKIQMLVVLQFPDEMNRKLIELRGTYNQYLDQLHCANSILILTATNKIIIYISFDL